MNFKLVLLDWRRKRRTTSRNHGHRFWTGAPCSPERTWAENGFFQCSHSMGKDSCYWPSFFAALQKRSKELRPAVFSPCTLGRTWGTRPGRRASFFAPTTATPMNSKKVANKPGSQMSRTASRYISSRPCGTGLPFKSNPGLSSWAKYSCPCGTESKNGFLTHPLLPVRYVFPARPSNFSAACSALR
jgi:hypothetical protein